MDCEAENIPVHGGESLEFVVLGVLSESHIDVTRVIEQAAHESLAEAACRGAESAEGVELLEIGDAGATAEIALVEELDGGLAAFAAYSHGISWW